MLTDRVHLLKLLLISSLLLACSSGPSLKDGDIIIFFGDSITELGVKPGGYVTLVREAIESAGVDVQVIGSGISGHRVPNLQSRLHRDVLSKDPTIVFVYIGINDVWHWVHPATREVGGTTIEDFEGGLYNLIQIMQEENIRVILCTPTVIGEQRGGVNPLDGELDRYANISRKISQTRGVQLLDLRQAFVDHLEQNNPDDLKQDILTYDGVHLNDQGNQLLADLVLQALSVK